MRGLQLLAPEASAKLLWGGQLLGYLGSLPPEGLKRFDLRGPTVVAELRMALLVETASLVPRYEPLSPFPAVSRDLNLVVAEAVRWADVACTVRRASGEYFESLDYCDTYRDPQRLGEGKKSLLMRLTLRSKKARSPTRRPTPSATKLSPPAAKPTRPNFACRSDRRCLTGGTGVSPVCSARWHRRLAGVPC